MSTNELAPDASWYSPDYYDETYPTPDLEPFDLSDAVTAAAADELASVVLPVPAPAEPTGARPGALAVADASEATVEAVVAARYDLSDTGFADRWAVYEGAEWATTEGVVYHYDGASWTPLSPKDQGPLVRSVRAVAEHLCRTESQQYRLAAVKAARGGKTETDPITPADMEAAQRQVRETTAVVAAKDAAIAAAKNLERAKRAQERAEAKVAKARLAAEAAPEVKDEAGVRKVTAADRALVVAEGELGLAVAATEKAQASVEACTVPPIPPTHAERKAAAEAVQFLTFLEQRAEGSAESVSETDATAAGDAALEKYLEWSAWYLSASAQERMARYVLTCPGLEVPAQAWDANPFLLNTPDGVLDLRARRMLPHSPEQRHSCITAVTPYMPGDDVTPERKRAEDALERLLVGFDATDPEIRGFVQRLAGLSLLGMSGEIFSPQYGAEGCGKSTVWASLVEALGRYALNANAATFEAHSGETGKARPDLISLARARFAYVDEMSHIYIDTDFLKRFTSGTPMPARQLYGTEVTIRPRATLLCSGNERVRFSTSDGGMVRRFYPVEYVAKPRTRDASLKHILTQTEEGHRVVLTWAVEGAYALLARWTPDTPVAEGGVSLEDALAAPRCVIRARAAYLAALDPLADFRESYLIELTEAEAEASDAAYFAPTAEQVREVYCLYARKQGVKVMSTRELRDRLAAAGFELSEKRYRNNPRSANSSKTSRYVRLRFAPGKHPWAVNPSPTREEYDSWPPQRQQKHTQRSFDGFGGDF